MPTEDEFRNLCARVVDAQTPQELERAITDLRIALRDLITDIENEAIPHRAWDPKLKARAA